MRTDRELLEMAAKAEGRVLKIMTQIKADGSKEEFVACWHPGRDDGDCSRMEAAIGLNLEWWTDSVTVCRPGFAAVNIQYGSHNGDKQAARRMASLLVAAEIGASMP